MSIVKGEFSLVCSKCGKKHSFQASDSDFDAKSSTERQMGVEQQYFWEHTIMCENNNCANEILIKYEIWEYPEGVFNYDKITTKGGDVGAKFSYSFH